MPPGLCHAAGPGLGLLFREGPESGAAGPGEEVVEGLSGPRRLCGWHRRLAAAPASFLAGAQADAFQVLPSAGQGGGSAASRSRPRPRPPETAFNDEVGGSSAAASHDEAGGSPAAPVKAEPVKPVKTAKLPTKSSKAAGTEPDPSDKSGIICGVSAGQNQDGRITCGIPMHRDKQTGAPYIVPLYQQPSRGGGGGGAPGGAVSKEALATRQMEAAVSARLRQEGLALLSRFLDAVPDGKAPLPAGIYPVPSSGVPGGIEVVPDLGALGGGATNAEGGGAFL